MATRTGEKGAIAVPSGAEADFRAWRARLRTWRSSHQGRYPSGWSLDGEEYRLARWVTEIRGRYREGRLAAWQLEELERLPGWSWRPVEEAFERNLEAMACWLAAHPGCWPQRRSAKRTDSDDIERRLAIFAMHQRDRHRAGTLRGDRVAALESIPGWSWGPSRSDLELAAVEPDMLRRWLADHPGRWPTAATADREEKRLATWISRRRRAHHEGRLSELEIRRLQSIPGWQWAARPGPRVERGGLAAEQQGCSCPGDARDAGGAGSS